MLLIVQPATYRRRLGQSRRGIAFQRSGRPRLTEEIRQLVLRLARENVLWGYRRIVGEMKKLGLYLGPSSVKRILQEFGIFPAPEKAKSSRQSPGRLSSTPT